MCLVNSPLLISEFHRAVGSDVCSWLISSRFVDCISCISAYVLFICMHICMHRIVTATRNQIQMQHNVCVYVYICMCVCAHVYASCRFTVELE